MADTNLPADAVAAMGAQGFEAPASPAVAPAAASQGGQQIEAGSPPAAQTPGLPPPTASAEGAPAGTSSTQAADVPIWVEHGFTDRASYNAAVKQLIAQNEANEQKARQYEIDKARWETYQQSQQQFQQQNVAPVAAPKMRSMEEIFPTAPGAKTAGWIDAMQRDPIGYQRTLMREMLRGDPEIRSEFGAFIKGEAEPLIKPLNEFRDGYTKNYQQYAQTEQQRQQQAQIEGLRNQCFARWSASKPEYAQGTPAAQAMAEHYQKNAQIYHSLIAQGVDPFQYHAPLVAQQILGDAKLNAANTRAALTNNMRQPARPGAANTATGTGLRATMAASGAPVADIEAAAAAFADVGFKVE